MTLYLHRTEKRWEEKQSEIYYPQPDYIQGRRFNGRPKWHTSVMPPTGFSSKINYFNVFVLLVFFIYPFLSFFIVGRKEFSIRFFCRFLIFLLNLRNIISPFFTGTHQSISIKSQIHNEFAGFIGFFNILEQLKNYSSLCYCASFFFVNQQKPFWALKWCLADLYRCEKDLICEYKSDGFSSRKALHLLAWFTLLLIIFSIFFLRESV